MSLGKHYSAGSAKPNPPNDGKLRLYSMRFCPFAQRAHLILDAKGIPHDVIYINLIAKPEWYLTMNPLGKVPALEITPDTFIYESLVVSEYLDEKYPDIPILPKDPLARAKDKILVERFNAVIGPMYKLYLSPTGPEGAPGALAEFVTGLDIFEQELKQRSSQYFAGKKPGFVDYMIWPWCERADMLRVLGGDKYVLDEDRFKLLLAWRELMTHDAAVKKTYISAEYHAKFIKTRNLPSGPDYDMVM